MPVSRSVVKDCQRRMAELDRRYHQAKSKLDAAIAKRAAVVAAQDQLVEQASEAVSGALGDLVSEFGTETAGKLLGAPAIETGRKRAVRKTPTARDR